MIQELAKIAGLFALTAVAEIVGCYVPWMVLKQGKPTWLLMDSTDVRQSSIMFSSSSQRGCYVD